VSDDITLLCGTAASIGLLHTLLGPDHYLPFVAMSRAGRWSLSKTIVVTALCGLAHVLGSVILGVVGIVLGMGVFKLEAIEGFRADLAGWLLLAFGLVYFAWGVRRAIRNKPHTHWHGHGDGIVHVHNHVHTHAHLHAHERLSENAAGSDAGDGRPSSVTPWVLFAVFLFGPCEPLIPLLMYPAAKGNWSSVIQVTAVFAGTTLATMIATVIVAWHTLQASALTRLERYGHALAGLVVLICGAAIKAGL
jgi:ABC-type nickel/cobalt efflux system permease component RcnA